MSSRVSQKTGISGRALASMALFCAGVWLIPSGIALHFASHEGSGQWSHLFMVMHNTASFFFLIAVVMHIILNWKVLIHYVNAKIGEYRRFRLEMLIAVVGVSIFVLLAVLHTLH